MDFTKTILSDYFNNHHMVNVPGFNLSLRNHRLKNVTDVGVRKSYKEPELYVVHIRLSERITPNGANIEFSTEPMSLNTANDYRQEVVELVNAAIAAGV